MFTLLFEVTTLSFPTAPALTNGLESGALSSFNDVEAATLVGGLVALSTVGGAAALGAALLPGQTAAGLLTAGTFVGLGEVKKRTGTYLPFLHSKDEVTAVKDADATAV